MIIVKGVEIIPKRDKVTYATNILGKWDNFNIETPEGAAVRATFEIVKQLTKEGKLDDIAKEADNLKAILLNPVEEVVEKQVIVEPLVPKVVYPENTFFGVPFEKQKPKPKDAKYVVEMDVNKSGRMMYLGWFDYDDLGHTYLQPSVVPTIGTKEKCEKMVDLHRARVASVGTNEKQIHNLAKTHTYNIVEVKRGN